MLVPDPAAGKYDAAATPSTGTESLSDFYLAVLAGARRRNGAIMPCSDAARTAEL